MASVRTLDESTIPAKLDATDWRILAELQKDGRITNVELASRVGLSAPPCLRRVRELERSGVIAGYHAVFNLPRLGFHLTAFAFVRLESQAEPDLLAFEARARRWDIVREAYMLSGDTDFLLKCVAPDSGDISELHHPGADRSAKCELCQDCLYHQDGEERAGRGDRITGAGTACGAPSHRTAQAITVIAAAFSREKRL